jgi:hypothetical protein
VAHPSTGARGGADRLPADVCGWAYKELWGRVLEVDQHTPLGQVRCFVLFVVHVWLSCIYPTTYPLCI